MMKRRSILFYILIGLLCFSLSAFAEGETDTVPAETQVHTKGFVHVTTSTMEGWLPLPLEEDYTYPLIQTLADGTTMENDIHLMPDGFYVESSDCDNQLCVEEGTVTLDNREDRILGSMVVCLPHQLMLELYSYEEVLAMVEAQQ